MVDFLSPILSRNRESVADNHTHLQWQTDFFGLLGGFSGQQSCHSQELHSAQVGVSMIWAEAAKDNTWVASFSENSITPTCRLSAALI